MFSGKVWDKKLIRYILFNTIKLWQCKYLCFNIRNDIHMKNPQPMFVLCESAGSRKSAMRVVWRVWSCGCRVDIARQTRRTHGILNCVLRNLHRFTWKLCHSQMYAATNLHGICMACACEIKTIFCLKFLANHMPIRNLYNSMVAVPFTYIRESETWA